MSFRSINFRALVVAWILALVLSLLPLATALAGGGGTPFPH
jgi:uncharacterized membrane protein